MDTSAFLKNSRFVLLATFFLLVTGSIYFFRTAILPFAVGAFLAYLLAPVVSYLAKTKIRAHAVPRGAVILVVYAIGIGMLTVMGLYLVPKLTTEVNALVRDLPRILKEIEKGWVVPTEKRVNQWLLEFVPRPAPLVPELSGEAEEGPPPPPGLPPTEPNGRGQLTPLLEDYTYLVRRVDEETFEIVPKRRDLAQTPPEQATWDFSRQISRTFQQFRNQFQENIVELLRLSRGYLVAVVSSFFTTFLVLMISAFILVDPGRVPNFVRTLVPGPHQEAYDELIVRLDHGLSGVVRGQVLICLINGTLTGFGIALLGVPFVITLSMVATLFSLIPIFGVLISTIPIILLALTVSFSTALLALGWILMIHFFEGNFLNPKILGDSARIHPVLIVFALVAGEYLGGIMGALLAVPVFSLIQNSFLFLKGLAERVETAS